MSIVNVNFFSESLMRMVNFVAVIPIDKRSVDGESLRNKNKPLKTLYLLHGIYGGEWDWITTTRIKKWAMDRNLAVIMPAGENGFYNNHEAMHTFYRRYVGEELVAFTRTMFRLSEDREDTYIAGLSMGGLGAVYSGFHYPETFGYVGSLSTALLADDYPAADSDEMGLLSNRTFMEAVFGPEETFKGGGNDYYKLADDMIAKKVPVPEIYMACGVDDPLLEVNRKYVDYLRKANIKVKYQEDEGAHDWAFWDRNLYRFIEWLPLEKKPTKRIYDF